MTKAKAEVDVVSKGDKRSNSTNARVNNNNKSVTVVVIGDEGVGKTSLISTYISRHFVEEGLPGCMTRFTLPPDTITYMPYLILEGEEDEEKGAASLKGFVCSIVDTQGTDATFLPKPWTTADRCSADVGDANATSKINSSSSSSSLTSPNSSLSSPTVVTNTILSSTADDVSLSMTQKNRTSIPTAHITKNKRDAVDANAIVIVYDLVRSESFTRLEEYWLPLIETCFDGEIPVIIAGNKFDLWLDQQPQEQQQQQQQQEVLHHHQHHPTDRQKIVSLLQRYPFVRQCIKCSAKTLFHVTDIFQKAQHAVLFPIRPIYDIQHDALTVEAQRAFCRIFRMADLDNDGYLSNAELLAFQTKCYRVWGPLFDETVSGWNKILSKKILSTTNNSSTSKRNPKYFYCYQKNQQEDDHGLKMSTPTPIVQNDKFTMEGFFSIFEVFMSKDRMEIPWQILRLHGYDDNLHLHIPPFLLQHKENHETALFPLSSGAISFLTSLFELFDVDKDGILTESGVLAVFAILPINEELPPWHPARSHKVFKDAFSLPILQQQPHNNENIIKNNKSKKCTGVLSLPDGDSSFTADGITVATNSCDQKNDYNSNGSTVPLLNVLSCNTELDDVIVEQHSSSLSSSADEKKRYRQLIHPPLSLLEWINHWIMSACISPTMTVIELYRLGYVEGRPDHDKKSFRRLRHNKQPFKSQKYSTRSTVNDHQTIRVRVFGKDNFGKAKLIKSLCQTEHNSNSQTIAVEHQQVDKVDEEINASTPLTSCTHIVTSSSSATSESNNDIAVHFVFTDMPETVTSEVQDNGDVSEREETFQRNMDLVMLVFDCADNSSLSYLLDLEQHLEMSKPRVFIGIRFEGSGRKEILQDSRASFNPYLDDAFNQSNNVVESKVLSMAKLHCSNQGIEHPLIITVDELRAKLSIADSTPLTRCCASKRNMKMAVNLPSSTTPDKKFVLRWLYQCTLGFRSKMQGKLKSIPSHEQRQGDTTKTTKILWMGCGLFVLTGILLWRTNSKSTHAVNKDNTTKWKWWKKGWLC